MIPRHLIIGVAAMLAVALGMSLYAWRMRGRATQAEQAAEYPHPVAAPVQGPGRQERAEELLRALLGLYMDKASSHPLGPGSEVRDVYLVDPGLAVIDLNDAVADAHRSGVLVEELTVASLVQTLATGIPGINRVKILVGGKERETLAGHADLSCVYDVSAVGQMVAELQK